MSQTPHKDSALLVRQALWSLQKEVLNSLKEDFDRELGYAAPPTEWFQALMSSERYIWLRELTSLMADIDILTELDFITEQHAQVARNEIEHLLFNQTAEDGFAKNYRDLLMATSSLLPHHSQLKSSLQNLPESDIPREQSALERKNWHEEHRHQARKKRN